MTDTETLTAALRRLADEHASGLLSVATPGRDVVLELADGVPVGIGPTHDVSDRVGREASAELVAAAVIDGLVDRTVAAIVGGGGDWVWDVTDSATMMPVPPNLAAELSRRAVDAAQALATLATDQVLAPARDLETHGEVDRVRSLFDGERTVEDVAELSGLTVPAVATLAAALVAAGVLSTGQEEAGPVSWTDAVAGSSTSEEEEEQDEPELWVMDPPDEEEDDEDAAAEGDEAAAAEGDEIAAAEGDEAAAAEGDEEGDEAAPAAHAGGDQITAPRHGATETPASEDPPTRPTPIEQHAAPQEEAPAEPTAPPEAPAAATDPVGSTAAASVTSGAAGSDDDDDDDDDWSDTTWLDELDSTDGRGRTTAGPSDHRDADESGESRAALSAMISDLQRPDEKAPTAPAPASRGNESRPEVEPDDTDASEQRVSPEARRKEPKAAPGEVAEFLRELSRLALDDE